MLILDYRDESSEHIETLDGDVRKLVTMVLVQTESEAIKEYEILLENSRKRDQTYQSLIKENEVRIIDLTEENAALAQKVKDQGEVISNFDK